MEKLTFLKKNKLFSLNRILLVVVVFTFINCNSEKESEVIHLYSKDKSQVVSIISNYSKNIRVIAVGKHTSKPKKNYIELDISKTPKLGDEFGICWNINGHNWEMVNDKAKVIRVKLDTTMYIFRENWFKTKLGTPTPKYYRQNNCFTVGAANNSKHKPRENGSVERIK